MVDSNCPIKLLQTSHFISFCTIHVMHVMDTDDEHKVKELEQENIILKEVNELTKEKVEELQLQNEGAETELSSTNHKARELEQEKALITKALNVEEQKNLRLSKKHILTIAVAVVAIGIVTTGYSLYVVQLIGQEYRVPNTGSINDGYVIQNLQGDTVDTWLSWRLVDGTVLHVNVIDASKYPGKLDLIKEVVLSQEPIEIDDSLLHKGPQGSTSTYYVGWAGALAKASEDSTEFYIPDKLDVIESTKGAGDIAIMLVNERSGDGYSGYAKSIVDASQNQILKSYITIYEVDKLSDEQFKIVLRHELGHAFGLGHSTAPEDLMAPIIKTEYPYISECDLAAIVSLYDGEKKSDVTCEK